MLAGSHSSGCCEMGRVGGWESGRVGGWEGWGVGGGMCEEGKVCGPENQ